MNLNSLTSHPVFQTMSPQKQRLLQECVRLFEESQHSEGAGFDKSLPIMLAMYQKMQKQGLSFSPKERDVLIEVLSSQLTPSERSRMESMKRFFH